MELGKAFATEACGVHIMQAAVTLQCSIIAPAIGTLEIKHKQSHTQLLASSSHT
jgi:hypothetical protein